jgi:hypothetical protein
MMMMMMMMKFRPSIDHYCDDDDVFLLMVRIMYATVEIADRVMPCRWLQMRATVARVAVAAVVAVGVVLVDVVVVVEALVVLVDEISS